jgi:hypothetical protein
MMAAVVAARRAPLAWVLALASLTVLCAPGVASAAPTRQDSVTAVGSTDTFTNLRIRVTSGPDGENPTGRVSFDVPTVGVHAVDAPITCLNVSGRFASLGVSLPDSGIGGVVLVVADNGPAGSGFDTVTFVSLGSPPSTCPKPFGGIGSLTGGDIIVTDAGLKPGLGCGDQNAPHAEASQCGQQGLTAGLKEDSATGTGDFSGFDDVAFDIRSGANGENPTGSLAVNVSFFGGVRLESASITCFAVRGGAAVIGGTAKPNTVGVTAAIVRVSDNRGFGVPDGFSAAPVAEAPTTCPPPTPFTTPGATGDIVVLDAGFKPNKP